MQLRPFNVVEVGAGSGLMMADMLRTLSQFSNNLRGVDVSLVEASENLTKVQ